MASILANWGAAAFSTVTSVIGGVFSRATSFLSGLFGGLLSRIVSVFTALPGLIFGALGHLADGVKGAMGAAASALKYGLYGLVGIVGGAVAIIGKSIQQASTWSQSLRTLSASTGLGARASGAVQSRFGAVGLDASQVLAGQNPALYGMRASVYGLGSYTDPNFLPSAAGRFQSLNSSGITGQMLAQGMAKSLGLGDAAGLRTLGTPVGELRKQQQFSSSVRSGLGLDDGALVKVGRQWDQFTTRFKVFGESILLKIAQSVLPRLNAGLDMLSRLAEKSAGGLGAFIEKGINATFNALGRLAAFLYKTGPEAVLGFTAMFLRGLLTVSDAIPGLWDGMMKLVDIGQAGFDWLAKTGSGAFDILSRAFAGVSAGIGEFIKQLPAIGTMLSGVWDKIRDGINGLIPGLIPGGGGTRPAGGGSAGQLGQVSIPGVSNPNASPYTSPVGIIGGLWNAGRFLTMPGGWAARQAAHAVGADAPWQQGAADLAGRYIGGRMLLAGGRAALATPVGQVTTAAVGAASLVGYGAFSGAQALGLVDRDQSFLGRLGLGALRVADTVTGNWGETDRRANEQWALERAQAHGRATGHPMQGDYAGTAAAPWSAIRNAATNAYNAPTSGPLADLAARLQGGLAQVPVGSWHSGLENKFGNSVRGGAGNASESIQRALAAIEKAEKNVAGRPDLEALIRDLLHATKGIEANTDKGHAERLSQRQMDRFAQIVGRQLSGAARNEYLALVSR